jgi:hypothetical protein
MKGILERAFFGGTAINVGQARRDIAQAELLISDMR